MATKVKTLIGAVRFFGCVASLNKWAEIIRNEFSIETGAIKQVGKWKRDCFDVVLTDDQITVMREKYWYAESGTGVTATNRPYRWNDCIGFEHI